MAFASLNKQSVSLNENWAKKAAKELKGKDVKETLVKESNE